MTVDRGLYNHIKNAIVQGKTKTDIRLELANGGWTQAQVDEAYEAVQKGEMPEIPSAQKDSLLASNHQKTMNPWLAWVEIFLFAAVVLGGVYFAYYLLPLVDLDVVHSEVTAYPALCSTVGNVVLYSADTKVIPATFRVNADLDQVVEYLYTDYKSAFDRGSTTAMVILDNCAITDRIDWKCTDKGASLGFSEGHFFNDALHDPGECFVSRAQWYRLLYPPLW
jgi:hypothetical protein